MCDAHVVSVFGGPGCAGNPTGVVQRDFAIDPGQGQAVASRLGLPDTVFFWPATSGAWEARFFSPSQELSVCYQALLGAAEVLRGTETAFVLRDRRLTVVREAGLGWVSTPHDRLRVEPDAGCVAPGGHVCSVVDAGRRRAYAELDAAEFGAFALEPGTASTWLEANGVAGLCLFHRTGPNTLRLRVFTTSLDGHEDVATGGAVAGLPLALGEEGAWTVDQGLGGAHRRGRLHVRTAAHGVEVGGHAEAVLTGRLA